MKNIRTISSRGMLQRISSMFGIKDANWHGDAIDWIGDAMQFIGYHVGFETKPITVNINNYRANIPNCLESLNFIIYNGHRLPLGVDESDYGFVNCEVLSDNVLPSNLPVATYPDMLLLNKEIDRLAVLQTQLDETPTDPNVIQAIIDCNAIIDDMVRNLRLGSLASRAREFYNIEGDYIKTSFPTGKVILNGECFILDEKGFPRIVDEANYKEAISWFIIYRMLMRGDVHPTISFKMAKEEWEDYTYKASNNAKMPSLDELERFTNRWTSVKREAQPFYIVDL